MMSAGEKGSDTNFVLRSDPLQELVDVLDRIQTLARREREVACELAAVDVVVAAEGEIGFKAARTEDASEAADPGFVDASLPPTDDGLLGPDCVREGGLGQTCDRARLADQRAGVDPADRDGVRAISVGGHR